MQRRPGVRVALPFTLIRHYLLEQIHDSHSPVTLGSAQATKRAEEGLGADSTLG